MKNIIFAILLILSLVCCDSEPTIKHVHSSNISVIDVTNSFSTPERTELSDIIQEIKIIPLETNELSVLAYIKDIKISDKYIYIRDSYKSGSIAIFDISGKFIKRLQIGQAPHEIGSATSMFVSKEDKQLFVFDDEMAKIQRYTLDGNYISSYYFYALARDFVYTDNHFVFIQNSSQNENGRFSVMRSDTSFSNFEYHDLGTEIFDASFFKYFQKYDGGFNFTRPMDNMIYQFRHDSVYIRYSIINNNNTNVNYAKYKDIREMLNNESENNIYFDGTNIETDNFLYLNFYSKKEPMIELIWNKKNQSSFILNRKEQSLLRYVNIGSAHCDDPNYLVGMIRPASLISSYKPEYKWDGENPNNMLSESDMDILKTIQEEDNPIVVLLKLNII